MTSLLTRCLAMVLAASSSPWLCLVTFYPGKQQKDDDYDDDDDDHGDIAVILSFDDGAGSFFFALAFPGNFLSWKTAKR